LVALLEAHSLSPTLAITWRYRRDNHPSVVPCRFTLAAVVSLPRSTAN
jgi:hypothetical protein